MTMPLARCLLAPPLLRRALTVVLLALPVLASAPLAAADYRIGERLTPQPKRETTHYRQIGWEDLTPKNWDPMAAFKGMKLDRLQDNDPRAMELLEKMKAAWADAPVEPSLAGQRIRLPGFIIPLERKGDLVSELLLVPYYGACIHVPPPPANQTVHVVLKKPVAGPKMMDAYWINGTISIKRGDSSLGIYGYRIDADRIDPYGIPARKR